MPTAITPIQTKYRHHLFRSRLEARWAVFFESVGAPYEYENEGFELASGTWYLPDFYLREIGTYVEIKPAKSSDPSEEWPDHEGLASDVFPAFVVLVGEPWLEVERVCGRYGPYENETWGYGGFVPGDCYYRFCECPECGMVGIQFDGRAGRLCCGHGTSDKGYNVSTPKLLYAYKRAMTFRF